MRFQGFDLIGKADTGVTDDLGNVEYPDELLGTFAGRFTQWTADDVSVLGRELTTSNRKLLTKAPRILCTQATGVRIDGKDYDITNVADFGRWRCLYVKGYRI